MSITRSLNATALHARTADLCTTNLWIEDSGFTVPASYSSAREEQWALAERAALSDLSARQVWSFRGADAGSFLGFATLHDAAALAPARAQDTYWCDDNGFVRGKGMLIRRDVNAFEMMTPIRDIAWMLDGAEGFDIEVRDITNERAALGVAGPLAAALLSDAGLLSKDLHAGDVAEVQWRASRVSVLRRGDGASFELLMPAEDAILVWDRLWRSGRTMGLGVAGADALDVVRVEEGRLKPAVDWLPVQAALNDEDLKLPMDFGVTPDLTRRFNGIDALRRHASDGRQIPVQLIANEAVVTGSLMVKDTSVGRVTSTAWSEARNEAVALAWADATVAKVGATLTAHGPGGPVEARVSMAVQGRNA
jgi:aminomethyltransferase